MAKRKTGSDAAPDTTATGAEPGTAATANSALSTEAGSEGAADAEGHEGPASADADDDLPPPPIHSNGEIMPVVAAAATTITGCTDAEVKNFLATADYCARNLVAHLAANWKKITRTAKIQGDEGRSQVVPVSVALKFNLENMLLHDTSMKLSFALKHTAESETQEDLRQVTFKMTGSDATADLFATATAQSESDDE